MVGFNYDSWKLAAPEDGVGIRSKCEDCALRKDLTVWVSGSKRVIGVCVREIYESGKGEGSLCTSDIVAVDGCDIEKCDGWMDYESN